ncbi:hypothetical protein JIN84_19275 [Luteolibacter yonseiensis]|uniref:Uncharacterized protein n=1 Tax=Luteolibacter yonseiensis TaxID=1144680 RepID=A0A934R958_9BACT|nr:hypothetical protein [Luteolibacter yonseiensis]MBK1817770.1 hypothetical protein [Luteolibacter yonseiensis]
MESPTPAPLETTRKTSPRASPPRPVWTTDDFIKLARDRARIMGQPGYNPLAETLADWTDSEIIAALDACLTDPDVVLGAGSAEFLDGNLLDEWMRRDFDSALAWFEKLESRSAKSRLAVTLGNRWPADKADQGLAFLQANRELFPLSLGDSILNKAFEAAARRGPAAMEKMLKILRENEIDTPGGSWRFPPDFDFATLSRSTEIKAIWGNSDSKAFLEQWVAQNSDQAFDWILGYPGADSLPLLFKCSQDCKWLGSKFETLDAGQRAEFMDDLKSSNTIPPALVAGFIEGIGDPIALQGAYEMLAQNILRGNVEDQMRVLEEIGDTAIRISLLKNVPPAETDGAGEPLLRQKLIDWKASPEQIESIVSRYKP